MLPLLAPLPAAGQLSTLSLDLQNNVSLYRSSTATGEITLSNYGQFYVGSLGGYVLDPKLAAFTLETSLSDNASTSSMVSESQRLRSRNMGYYNFSMSILPCKKYPLNMYASRSDATNIDLNGISSFSGIARPSTVETQTMGFRWNIPRNGLPQTEISADRTRNRGGNALFPVDRTEETWSVRMNNSSDAGTSRYMLQYTGVHDNDPVFRLNRMNHEIQFNGNSALSSSLDLSGDALYALRDLIETRRADVTLAYRQSDALHHQIRVVRNENLYQASMYEGTSTEADYQAIVGVSDRTQGTFGCNYERNAIEAEGYSALIERQSIRGSISHIGRNAFAELHAFAATDLGFSRYPSGGRKFVQHSSLSAGGTSSSIGRLMVSIQDNVELQTEYYFGNIVNNAARLAVTTDYLPGCVVGTELSQRNSRYLGYAAVYPRSTTSVKGNLSTRVASSIAFEVEHTEAWNHAWYLERQRRTSVTVTSSGLINNLALQVRGEREFNSFTGLTMILLAGSFEYRFGAFALAGRLSRFSLAGNVTDGLYLEIRRPFRFGFQ